MKIYALSALFLVACSGSVAEPIERRAEVGPNVAADSAVEEDAAADSAPSETDASSSDSSATDSGSCDLAKACAAQNLNCGTIHVCGTDVNCGTCMGELCGDNGKANVCGTTCQHDPDAVAACAASGYTDWVVPTTCQNGAPWKSVNGKIVTRDSGLDGCAIGAIGNKQYRCCAGF